LERRIEDRVACKEGPTRTPSKGNDEGSKEERRGVERVGKDKRWERMSGQRWGGQAGERGAVEGDETEEKRARVRK
jgi:hypothetical protein